MEIPTLASEPHEGQPLESLAMSVQGQPGSSKMSPRLRRVVSFLVVAGVLIFLWEGYKFVWQSFGWIRPVRPDNTTMPHV
jgi:hypothetical protein